MLLHGSHLGTSEDIGTSSANSGVQRGAANFISTVPTMGGRDTGGLFEMDNQLLPAKVEARQPIGSCSEIQMSLAFYVCIARDDVD